MKASNPQWNFVAILLLTALQWLPAAAFAEAVDAAVPQTIEVTGTRIRRVDKETSNPVLTLGSPEIQASGATTLGELLQSLPLVSGSQTNAQYNDPPSGGATTIGLRGLTSSRTLLLLDGQRLVSSDVSLIPLNMVDHIDILKQGASAVYGSDAIAGVVNIITVNRFKGLDIAASYGESQAGDDGTSTASVTFGESKDRNRLVVGLAYNDSQPIHASDRWFSAKPYGFADGQVADYGQASISTPTGALIKPVNAILGYGCPEATPILTRIQGTNGSTRADFRCFNYSPFSSQGSDLYNYQTDNYLKTPVARESLFGLGNHRLNEDIDGFASVYYTHTDARSQEAPETLSLGGVSTLEGQPVRIAGNSLYNPYRTPIGVNYEVDGLYSTLYTRNDRGDRIFEFSRDTYQATTGLKGNLLDRFQWTALISYGEEDTVTDAKNFEDIQPLLQGLGPSFINTAGVPTCGTPGTPIAGCTPIDLLGTAGATASSLLVNVKSHESDRLERANLDLNGDLFKLWAGPVGFETGYEFRRYELSDTPAALAQQTQLYEGNQGATDGAYNVNEFYGELLIPLLRDLPLVHGLNFDAGFRYSRYSTFSATENNKFAMEYRPVADLLLRATYADIFRAPTIQDLYGGFSQDAPTFVDPCNGISTPVSGSTPGQNAACENVVRNGHFAQLTTQAGAEVTSNPALQPETGYTTDFGLVYSPHAFTPLTLDMDYWRYTVKNAIDRLSVQSSLDACYQYDQFCGNVQRDNSGQVAKTYEPEINADRFDTVGLDFGAHLSYPHTRLGSFQIGIDTTYLQKFDYKVMPNGETVQEDSVTGQYNANVFDGGFPRFRSYGTFIWKIGNFTTTLADRFISNVNESVPANGTSCPDGSYENGYCIRKVGSANDVDVSETFRLSRIATELTFGINDVFDDGAQIAYSAPVPDTVLSMYDVTGRFFYGRVKVHFR